MESNRPILSSFFDSIKIKERTAWADFRFVIILTGLVITIECVKI